MTNARRVVGDASTFAHIFIHKYLQNKLNQYFLDSLALSLPIAERFLKVLRNQNTECVQVSKGAWDVEQEQWSLTLFKATLCPPSANS